MADTLKSPTSNAAKVKAYLRKKERMMISVCEKQAENAARVLVYTPDSGAQIQSRRLVKPLSGAICHKTRLKLIQLP